MAKFQAFKVLKRVGRTCGLTALQIGLKQQRSSYISLQNKTIRYYLFFGGDVKSDTKLHTVVL